VDYKLSYKNATAISTGKVPTIVVTGKGNFKGKTEVSYRIVRQDISRLSLVANDMTFVQKVNAWKAKVSVVDLDGKKLAAGKDYDKNLIYTYKNDTTLMDGTLRKAGEELKKEDILPADTIVCVTAKATGINYVGELTGEYRITKASLNKAKVTVEAQTYTGKAITPGYEDIKVVVNGTTLTKDDYIITGYSNNVQKGNATVTIQGIGQYGGTKSVKFTIKSKGFLWWWR